MKTRVFCSSHGEDFNSVYADAIAAEGVIMKKGIILVVFLLVILLSGCSYFTAKTYYREVNNYDEIWELTGFHHGYDSKSPLFPDEITNLNVEDFYCRYDERLPLGEGVQIFLKVVYNEDAFLAEQERIAGISTEDKKNFSAVNFMAYDLKMGDQGCWEYALLDNNQKAVYYIFLYNLAKNEIEFDKSLIPQNYIDYME